MILEILKNTKELTSQRSISLLLIFSKLFEKLLLKSIEPILLVRKLIPHYRLGFWRKQGTVEQGYHGVKETSDLLPYLLAFVRFLIRYCTSEFALSCKKHYPKTTCRIQLICYYVHIPPRSELRDRHVQKRKHPLCV